MPDCLDLLLIYVIHLLFVILVFDCIIMSAIDDMNLLHPELWVVSCLLKTRMHRTNIVVHKKDGPPPTESTIVTACILCYVLNGGRLFQHLYDALARGDNNAHDIGKRVFLPLSFTGGPSYMYKHYQDALAICRVYGNPQYFITFTCNVKWPEISRHLEKIGGTQAQNCPDIIARVFRIKVQQFLRFMRSNKTSGDVVAELYTIEFQKRGLPHCHTLLWVTAPYKVREAADADKYISAEIPDLSTDPALHKIVTDLMIHGPCGLARPSSPCMRDNICSKSFPKKFECNSRFDQDEYVHYRRRDTPQRATKNGVALDNRYVIPYNEHLCRHFNAHINVEHCGCNMMIKYLFKYISKGADRVRFCIPRSDEAGAVDPDATNPVVNEIKNFVDGRYICPHEETWRILNFPIHERTPAVEVLAVHLEDMHNVTFKENLKLQAIVRNPSFGKTTLTEWLESNKRDHDGLDLTYVNYSSRYRWYKTGTCWIPRVRLQNPAIGRLAYVHPAFGKLFYLRMLLCHQRGCKSFANIRTVSNVIHNTYRSACDALGLLGDDREWLTAFIESSSWATSSELRVLFIHMLLFCEETCYDRASLAADHSRSHLLLNSDQMQVYNCILSAYQTNSQSSYDVMMHTTTTQMACQRICDITERQKPLTIEIRVLRKWISKGKKEELCYQFVDIHGDDIEATAEVKHIEYFDSVINLQSCYKMSGYICTGPRTYMATVDHSASLVIGQKAKFYPVTNPNIPTVYFKFATYETIKTRIKCAKLLTDYIGRVEKNSLRSTSTGKQLQKTRLQDEMGREVEITLWPEMRHVIGDDEIPGDIVAITSTMVTEHNGLLQLESTYLTTAVVNPDVPQTIEHVERLRALPPMQGTETHDRTVTLLDLKLSSQQNFQYTPATTVTSMTLLSWQVPGNFTCEAIIKEIHEERGWYYVLCSKCSSKLYPEQDSGRLNFVCKNNDDITPNFRYSVNATIMDATGSADAIFFNDSMQALLNISCKDMVTKHADTTNPSTVPQLLRSAIGTPKLLNLTLKNDGKIVVNNVSEVASDTSNQSTGNVPGTSTFTPTTPLPKSVTSKKQLQDSPG
ncbi:hypothetical protein CASFOL_022571 [Castilleja foliolosa]|uniref:DNA helicase n=1 Tax=Castilleja foliolosa TaxID=1961234 RepID=A0ABD3CW55_9LAMI